MGTHAWKSFRSPFRVYSLVPSWIVRVFRDLRARKVQYMRMSSEISLLAMTVYGETNTYCDEIFNALGCDLTYLPKSESAVLPRVWSSFQSGSIS